MVWISMFLGFLGFLGFTHVTASVVWMDAATLFVAALTHSFKDLGTRTRSLLQDMGSSVGLPDMVLQHMQW